MYVHVCVRVYNLCDVIAFSRQSCSGSGEEAAVHIAEGCAT